MLSSGCVRSEFRAEQVAVSDSPCPIWLRLNRACVSSPTIDAPIQHLPKLVDRFSALSRALETTAATQRKYVLDAMIEFGHQRRLWSSTCWRSVQSSMKRRRRDARRDRCRHNEMRLRVSIHRLRHQGGQSETPLSSSLPPFIERLGCDSARRRPYRRECTRAKHLVRCFPGAVRQESRGWRHWPRAIRMISGWDVIRVENQPARPDRPGRAGRCARPVPALPVLRSVTSISAPILGLAFQPRCMR